jgi:hypothetical protein
MHFTTYFCFLQICMKTLVPHSCTKTLKLFAFGKELTKSSIDKSEPKVKYKGIFPGNSLRFNGFLLKTKNRPIILSATAGRHAALQYEKVMCQCLCCSFPLVLIFLLRSSLLPTFLIYFSFYPFTNFSLYI